MAVSQDNAVSFDEIYLFCEEMRLLEPVALYQNITQDGNIDLTKQRFKQLLLNINYADIEKLQEKDIYTITDVINLNLNVNLN